MACFATAPVVAKPLLDSSEDSWVSACLDYADSHERMVEICQNALLVPGLSDAQHLELQDGLGWALMSLKRFDESEAIYEEMRRADPRSALALRGLGWVYHGREDYARAKGFFNRARGADTSASTVAGLGDTLWELGEIGMEEAVSYMEAALAIWPGYDWANREKGWILLEGGAPERARTHFETFLRTHRGDVNALAGLTVALWDLSLWEEMVETAGRGVTNGEDDFWFLSYQGDGLIKLERYRRAMTTAERMLQIDPDNSEGHVLRARAEAQIGSRRTALEQLERAEAWLGRDRYITYWRAQILSDDGQMQAALTEIMRNTGAPGADKYDHWLAAWLQMELNDLVAARRSQRQAAVLSPDDPWTIYLDAQLLLEEGADVSRAVARFDAAIAEGLGREEIGAFATRLVENGHFLQAASLRMRHGG